MTILSKLSFSAPADGSNVDPVLAARGRFINALGEQLKAAEAMVAGTEYKVTRKIKNEAGEVQEVKKPIKKWYFRDPEGKVRMNVKIGNKRVELQKGKPNIVVGADKDLPGVIKTLIAAAEAGEMDQVIKSNMKTKS